jgi:hypothetical protein
VTAGASPRSLRRGFRRLATGLTAYGIIGLILAMIAIGALFYVASRVSSLATRVDQQIHSVVTTLDRTADVLADAASTATSFAVTIERTPPVVRQTAAAIAEVRSGLRNAQQEMAGIQILGREPLGGVADVFGRMASNLDGLDTRLELIAGDLEGNRTALLANAASLRALGDQMASMARDLEAGTVRDSFADLQAAIVIIAIVFVLWMTVPAAGALWLGRWLRAEVGRA